MRQGEALLAELKKWRSICGETADDELVLPWPKNTIRQFYDDWARIVAAAGLPKGTKPVPKHFRSTLGSMLIAAGTPTLTVRDFLGHHSVTTTESHYVHTSASTLRAASDALVSFMAREQGQPEPEKTAKKAAKPKRAAS